MNHYKLVYFLLQKIYRQPLKKIVYFAIKPRFPAQGEGQDLGWQSQTKAMASDCKAKAVGFKAKAQDRAVQDHEQGQVVPVQDHDQDLLRKPAISLKRGKIGSRLY